MVLSVIYIFSKPDISISRKQVIIIKFLHAMGWSGCSQTNKMVPP